jgi:DnaJ-domain-containing protein 1
MLTLIPMTDYFALLNEPRRPWIDVEELKEKFLALSSEFHPDRFHSASAEEKEFANRRYTDLNAAHACLREPKERLRHLLELEQGAKPDDLQNIPVEMTELFMEVGQLCREVDLFLSEKAGITSPLLKVEVFERGLEWNDKLKSLQERIGAQREWLVQELISLNEAWTLPPKTDGSGRSSALPLERLESIYRVFSYTNRWSAQIQERRFQLSL